MQAYADAVRSSSVILFFSSFFLAENIVLEIKIMGEHHMTWSTVKLLGKADGAPCVRVGPLYYRARDHRRQTLNSLMCFVILFRAYILSNTIIQEGTRSVWCGGHIY